MSAREVISPSPTLPEMVMGIAGFDGDLLLDRTKPDGTPRKLMDDSRLRALGWAPRISLKKGLKEVYVAMPAAGTGRTPRSRYDFSRGMVRARRRDSQPSSVIGYLRRPVAWARSIPMKRGIATA